MILNILGKIILFLLVLGKDIVVESKPTTEEDGQCGYAVSTLYFNLQAIKMFYYIIFQGQAYNKTLSVMMKPIQIICNIPDMLS